MPPKRPAKAAADEEDKATPVKTRPRVERKRVLVTGGAGFVGSHMCDALVARGDYVSGAKRVCRVHGGR